MGSRLDGQRRQKSVSPARPSFFSFDRGGSGGRGKLDSRHSVKTKLIMVFLEQFGAVEESNGTVPFGGLVIRDDCRREWLGTRLVSNRESETVEV